MPFLPFEYKGQELRIFYLFETIENVAFILVGKLPNNTYKKIIFKDINSFLDYEEPLTGKHRFIEYTGCHRKDNYNGSKVEVFRNILFDKSVNFIKDFQHFRNINNGWDVFLNSKRNIVIRNSTSGNIPFTGEVNNINSDFYVALSILINAINKRHIFSVPELKKFLKEEKENLNQEILIEEYESINIPTTSDAPDDPFSNLIGLNNVKNEIKALKALASIRKRKQQLNIPVSPTTLHLIFTGNPGTGKTTVARSIGEMYKEMGLLKKGHVIEVTSTDLEGKYVGHTAPKTKEIFEKALDGVLFIDEAYSLQKSGNNFGKEAIETLLKLMEDNREKIVVILAGYPNEMIFLLNSNPGLKDRFSTFIHFDDFSQEELKIIFIKMVSDMEHHLSEGALYKFDFLLEDSFHSGVFKSNARKVRNIFEEMQKRQSLRLSKLNSPTKNDLSTFIDTDVPDNL